MNWRNTLYYMNKLNPRAEPSLKVAFKKKCRGKQTMKTITPPPIISLIEG